MLLTQHALLAFHANRKHVDLKAFAYASTVVTEPVVTEQKMRTSSKYVDAEN